MQKRPLSQSLINSLKPGDKPYDVRDTRIRGLLLRVEKSGLMIFYLQYARGKRIRIGTSIPVEDAREIATAHLAALYKGKDPARVQNQAKGHTFLSFIEGEYQAWAEGQLRTHEKLIQRLKGNCKKFHSKKLIHITAQDFEKWRTARLADGKKRGTVNRDLDDVRGVLTKALAWGYIEINPLASVKKLKTDKSGIVRFLTSEEEVRLFEQLDVREGKIREGRASANEWRKVRDYPLFPPLHNAAFADHLKPMVLVAMHTGIRQGELFDLEWSDIDIARAQLTIRGEKSKNLQTRFIPLNSVALKALSDWRNQSDDMTGLVFPGKNGKRFDTVKTAWKAALSDANVVKFRWHDLRHTFASRLVMKGVDLNTVRELMGHADYQMTLRYSHLAPEHKSSAVEKLVAA